MVQAAEFGTLHDLPRRRKLDRPEVGCVLVEREVGARLMVIGKVSGQDTAKVSLAEDEHVIQALAVGRNNSIRPSGRMLIHMMEAPKHQLPDDPARRVGRGRRS